MALIKCIECGHDVSSEASQCPNCGFPIKTSSKKKPVFGIILMIILLILLVFIYQLVLKRPSAFKVAMTSHDYIEIEKSISKIDDPGKLRLISDRCSQLAKLKSNITIGKNKKSVDTYKAGILWISLAMKAAEKLVVIVDGEDAVKHLKAKRQIDSLKTALKLYKLDTGTYPETEQGLSALRQIPTTGKIPKNWRKGGYVLEEELNDPWGNKLIYKSPGRYSDYEIISYGADGQPGGDNENEDIKFSAP